MQSCLKISASLTVHQYLFRFHEKWHMHYNTFRGCFKVSLLICSTSTSLLPSKYQMWVSELDGQKKPLRICPPECLKSPSLFPHCSLLTFISESHHGLLALCHIHTLTHSRTHTLTRTLTHTEQYTFSPSTRPVAFLHKRNSQFPTWQLKNNLVKTDSYSFLACWPNTGKVAANICSVLHWISWMDVLSTQCRGFNSNKPPLWKLCFLLRFQAFQNIY